MLPKEIKNLPCETISLTVGHGDKQRVPRASGLNWGQRPGREQNQAYIPVSAYIRKLNFFPAKDVEFKILTDDGETFICARRQDRGKAIHSIKNNSLLGVYFRERLGLRLGQLVVIDDLRSYGRFTIDVYKINELEFFLDFGNIKDD